MVLRERLAAAGSTPIFLFEDRGVGDGGWVLRGWLLGFGLMVMGGMVGVGDYR